MSAEVTLAPGHRRALAIALLLVPVALVLLIAAPVFSGYQDHRDHMAVLARNYLSYQAAIADVPTERAAIARFRESRTLNDLVLPSQQASLAVAHLQSTISQIAATAGARVIQSASQIQAPDGALIELSTHITLEADMASVARLLYALEQARPLLMVRRCVIRDPDGEWQAADSAPGANRLQVELNVSGFMRPS